MTTDKDRIVFQKVPLTKRPSSENGVHHGTEDPILVCDPVQGKRLIWARGGAYWSGLNGTMYSCTGLQVQRDTDRRGGYAIYKEGGRLSKRLLREYKDQIDDFFGLDIPVEEISTTSKHTLVIKRGLL